VNNIYLGVFIIVITLRYYLGITEACSILNVYLFGILDSIVFVIVGSEELKSNVSHSESF